MFDEIGNLLLPDAAENEGGGVNTHLTEQNTLFENGNADIVGVRRQVTSDRVHAVTIGIGFENDHHFGGGGFFFDRFQICAKMIEINFDMCGAYAAAGGDGRLVELHEEDYKGFF